MSKVQYLPRGAGPPKGRLDPGTENESTHIYSYTAKHTGGLLGKQWSSASGQVVQLRSLEGFYKQLVRQGIGTREDERAAMRSIALAKIGRSGIAWRELARTELSEIKSICFRENRKVRAITKIQLREIKAALVTATAVSPTEFSPAERDTE